MVTISSDKAHHAAIPFSSHIRNAIAYMVLTSLMLIFLNIYSAATTRLLIYHSKAAIMQDKTKLVVSSFSGFDTLTTENVRRVISVLGNLNVSRVIVTDGTGQSLYDSDPQSDTTGKYILFPETVSALSGNDIAYCHYESGSLTSYAAMPILLYDSPIGCVYLFNDDSDQGAIISALERNIRRLSIAIEAIIWLFSLVFAFLTSRKMQKIMASMQFAREGEYSHKLQMRGSDEYGTIAEEFNKLTDRLQASEQAQRQFVSDASHELKTPLASIKLLSDSILQNDMDAATMREFVSDIGSEADRLTRMTQKLLSLTRAETADQTHEVVDLSQIIQQVFRMLIPLADQRGIRLTSTMEKQCTVLSQEDDMHEILFNLIENAIKYNTENGHVHVTFGHREDDIFISVEDTGIGIPEEAIPHVFERFYRVDKARSRQAGGAGLGLSIVYEMVVRNHGTITVQTRPEGGTCFLVQFPYFEVEESL